MADEPDLSFDIDSLFNHLINDLGYDPGDEKEWAFSLRSDDLAALEDVANELEEEFVVQLEESVEEVDADGTDTLGPPMLSIFERGALTAEDVKAIANRVRAIADARGLVYEGVTCYEPIDEDELFGWLNLDEAVWRLGHMTDCGIETNSDLPWAFLVVAPSLEAIRSMGGEFDAQGFTDRDEYDEPDDEGNFGLCIYVAGRNNEAQLTETSSKISVVAERHGGELEGLQFYTRENVREIFDGDSEA